VTNGTAYDVPLFSLAALLQRSRHPEIDPWRGERNVLATIGPAVFFMSLSTAVTAITPG
jgi:hypothetical protein